MKKKKSKKKEVKKYYNVAQMSTADRYREIRKVLYGHYDNWNSFGYSGGTCTSKQILFKAHIGGPFCLGIRTLGSRYKIISKFKNSDNR